jgi:hypothetical protein
MHGTRVVQKMIDFLSGRRQASYYFSLITPIKLTNEQQTDHRYDTQIHSIIVALSLHVVVLIKDLNGNHKCLNKLAPEDNQVYIIFQLLFEHKLKFQLVYL